jgi:hypothetical protein
MIPLPLIASNTLSDAFELFEISKSNPKATLDQTLTISTLISQAGIAEFFMSGEINYLAERALQASHFLTETLQSNGDQDWSPACLDALFSALAFNESNLEQSLFTWVSSRFQKHAYQDADQGTCLLLYHLVRKTQIPESVVTGLLADGSTDAAQRMAIADAARDFDSEAFNMALAERMESLRDELKEKCDNDDFVEEQKRTLAKLSFEGLAWIRVGERLGLKVDDEFPLTPYSACAGQRSFTFDPEGWRED